jgi:2-octaprenyl-6-methoxyphenol hydroxylase
MTECDIIISGGGPAGLIAAAAFGSAGFRVVCVDPAKPITDRDADGADLRTTAFLQPGRTMLERAGLWESLASHAVALDTMRIVDTGQETVTREFEASDLFELPFGWNLPNWLIRRAALARLNALEGVTFLAGVGTTRLFTRMTEARVGLSDGTTIRAKLVIAADGRGSPMRQAAGIPVKTWRYGQSALAFAVTHDRPHDNISTEVHRTGGPFTLVPLPDYQGEPSSAVVWMDDTSLMKERMSLSDSDFNAAMTDRSHGVLGPLRLASRRTIWPIISQRAERMSAERVALMAEAAHVMPPIGAQGLNTSLADLRCLLDLAEAAPDQLGKPEMLDTYDRQRRSDIRIRMQGIDVLNRASIASAAPLRAARATGLKALHDIAPVRRFLMTLGVGQ